MARITAVLLGLGVVAGILSFIWSAIHIPLYNLPFLPTPIRVFFALDGVISIIAGVLFILSFRLFTVKVIYLLEVIYWWINYLLLTVTRVFPAPIINRPLPVTTGSALYAFILDILLIIFSTVLYLFISGQ